MKKLQAVLEISKIFAQRFSYFASHFIFQLTKFMPAVPSIEKLATSNFYLRDMKRFISFFKGLLDIIKKSSEGVMAKSYA